LRVPKQKHKRSRLVVALMLPALILIWLVGWGMYCLGHQRENKSRTERPPEKNNVTLMPILELEEIQEEVA
jgi:heme/copper-type cytochrome/quinol oxidase subunit 2